MYLQSIPSCEREWYLGSMHAQWLIDLQVDFFDATGTLFAMANFMNNFLPGGTLPIPDLIVALYG